MPLDNSKRGKASRAVSAAWKTLRGQQLAGRNATIYPDDVVITSYPRSGNTWTRFLIGNLIYQDDPTTFANIESRVPEIYFNPDHVMRRLPRPRILKSHEVFQPHYRQVIYIVRDPRDVAVSFYHHNLKAGNVPDGYAMEDFIPRFIAAEFDTRWGSWWDHVTSWLALRENDPGFLLLRYEDMKKDPEGQLARVAGFLEKCAFRKIDSGPQMLKRAVELSSPERMRELEKSQAKDWVLTKQTRQDKPFVRSAKAGGWNSTLSPRSVALLESAWGDLMTRMGYQLAVTPAAAKSESAR